MFKQPTEVMESRRSKREREQIKQHTEMVDLGSSKSMITLLLKDSDRQNGLVNAPLQ